MVWKKKSFFEVFEKSVKFRQNQVTIGFYLQLAVVPSVAWDF
jgi:hypothetical protein